ncbi:uncharacterized protein LOC126293458 [Schistocerca gregaria]|uniref:uncharacterized protein LOC126293458 n=1 Tax=Schistocerca gregaria TaxID=7010 RepID=UPI00211E21B5|nr:uncharacterized protein LOC126293458 [Schistocerca gregaria]
MEWRCGIHVTVLVLVAYAILPQGDCVRRMDPPRFLEDTNREVKGYFLARSVNDSGFPEGSPESVSSAETVVGRKNLMAKGQFWLDLLNTMKLTGDEGDADVASKNLERIGMPLYLDEGNATSSNSIFLEPLIAIDGNKTGLLLLVKEGGRYVTDDTEMFTGDTNQSIDPETGHFADPILSSAAQATTSSTTQLQPAADDGEVPTDETATTLTGRIPEKVTSPTPEFAEKFTPLMYRSPNGVVIPALENKQLTLKQSNRADRVKRNAVVQDVSPDVWSAVHKPSEEYQARYVNSDFRNIFPLSEGQRQSVDGVQEDNGAASGLRQTSENYRSVPYSLVHRLGPQGADNVVHYTTMTKGVGGMANPEQEANQTHPGQHHHYQHDSMDNSRGDQTDLEEHLPAVHKIPAEEVRDGKRTLEDQDHPLRGTEAAASSRFVLQIPNTNKEHLHYHEYQSGGPVTLEVLNGAPSNEDIGHTTRFHWASRQFVSLYDDDDLENGGRNRSSLPVETEDLPARRVARRIWAPSLRSSQKAGVRRDDEVADLGEQSSGLEQRPADTLHNEVDEDKLKTAADGSSVQRSVMEVLLERLERCLRSEAMSVLDSLEAADVATIWPGVELVRVDGRPTQRTSGKGHSSDSTLGKDEDDRWAAIAVDKLAALLRSHAIRLRLPSTADDEREEGRRIRYRHQYKHMFPLVVMGYMVMSSFLVPLGFQLMAVLSGKALLLSKMALAVAGMAGFKRLFLGGLGPEYPVAPPVLHHETYPIYHEHHAAFAK